MQDLLGGEFGMRILFLCCVLLGTGGCVATTDATPPTSAGMPDRAPAASPQPSPFRLAAAVGTVDEPSPIPADPLREAQSPLPSQAAGGLDLQQLVELGWSHNPALSQAVASLQRAKAQRWQSGLPPNGSAGYFVQELGNDGSSGQHGVYWSQTWVRGDKLQWNRAVGTHMVESAARRVEVLRRRVATDIETRFWRAVAAQRARDEALRFADLAREAEDVARTRLQAEEGTRPDLLQSEILVERIELSAQTSDLRWRAAWDALAATIGVADAPPTTLIGELEQPTAALDAEACWARLESQSPLLRAAAAEVDRTRTAWRRQLAQNSPNVNTQLGVGFDASTDSAFANLQIGAPVVRRNRNEGAIAAARAAHCEAVQNLRRLRMRARRQLAGTIADYESARNTAERYRDAILPRAEESLKLIEQAYRGGESSFLRVLEARRELFEARLELWRALGEANEARAAVNGFLLTDGLESEPTTSLGGLRGQALSGQ